MPANSSTGSTSMPNQNQGSPANQGAFNSAPGGKQNNTLLLVLIVVILVVAIVVILLMAMGSFSTSTSGTTTAAALSSVGSTGGTPIYLGASQSEVLLGQVSTYQTFDLFNASSPINITYIDNVTPYSAGNVTEGWGTLVYGQNVTLNQSLEFFVMKANNASSLYSSIVSTVSQFYPAPPATQSCSQNGLICTYQQFENSSGNFQSVTGFKGDYVVFAEMASNPGFSVNQTALARIAANYT